MPGKELTAKDYVEYYEIATKTRSIVCEGRVVDSQVFDRHPYEWFGELKEKIEKGLIVFLAWNKRGVISQV